MVQLITTFFYATNWCIQLSGAICPTLQLHKALQETGPAVMNTNWAELGKTAISFNQDNACLRVAPDGVLMIYT